jgi:hypothetical protein
MVIQGRMLLACAVVLLTVAGTTCKVVNEDHCANQAVPGNEFCVELNTATPYCSPCRREYHGCVDFEPFACEGYDNEIGESQDGPAESTSDEPASTGEAPASTSESSTSDEPGSSSEGSGSGTVGSSG